MRFSMMLLSIVLIVPLFVGCKGDQKGAGGPDPDPRRAGIVMSGIVRETGGEGIDGVLLKVGDQATAYSSQDGSFELALPEGTSGKIVVELRREGYMTSWRPVFIPASVSHVTATMFMIQSGTPSVVDGSEGGTVKEGDVTLVIPPGALIDQHGNTVTGPVTVVLTSIDVTGPEVFAAPGDFTTPEEEGGDRLESFAMVDIHIYVIVGGDQQPVEVDPDATLELTIVVEDPQEETPTGSEAIQWWFDPSLGVWRAVGKWAVGVNDETGAVAYVAPVPAVGTWNVDAPFDVGCLEGKVVMNTGGNVSGLEVVAEGITYNNVAYGTTGSDGAYCVEVKPGEQARILAFCPQDSMVSETVETSTYGQCGSGTCAPGPTIVMPCCTEDMDCPPGQTCVNGLCESNCEDEGCPDGLVCAEDRQCIPETPPSNLGRNFWAIDLDNVEGGELQPLAVKVSVPTDGSAAQLTITDMASTPPTKLGPSELQVDDMSIPPGTAKVFLLPIGNDLDGSGITSRSFHVETTQPVSVHQFNPLNSDDVFTNDASLLFPSAAGGKEYIAASWPLRTAGYTLRGFVTVVATEEGTTKVEIWASAPVEAGLDVPAFGPNEDVAVVFDLEKGQVLNLETGGEQGNDLTGTRIQADKKVSVFGGHECANIPLGTDYCDHIEQQLLPTELWGTHYVGDAFTPRSSAQKDTWRIISAADSVQVDLLPPLAGPFELDRGEWVEFETGENFELTADGPVSLAHYLQSSNHEGFTPSCQDDTGIGDPALSLAIPVERYLKEYIVLIPGGYEQDFVNIVYQKGAESGVTINGQPLEQFIQAPYTPEAVGDTGWVVVKVPLADGVHTIKSTTAVGTTAYGYDCDVSYAYPGGIGLNLGR